MVKCKKTEKCCWMQIDKPTFTQEAWGIEGHHFLHDKAALISELESCTYGLFIATVPNCQRQTENSVSTLILVIHHHKCERSVCEFMTTALKSFDRRLWRPEMHQDQPGKSSASVLTRPVTLAPPIMMVAWNQFHRSVKWTGERRDSIFY